MRPQGNGLKKSSITLILISLLLSGCGFIREKVLPVADCEPVVNWLTYDCGVPPARDKVSLRVPTWVIDRQTGNWTLTAAEYSNLADSTLDIEMAFGQLREEIAFYEACILAAQIE